MPDSIVHISCDSCTNGLHGDSLSVVVCLSYMHPLTFRHPAAHQVGTANAIVAVGVLTALSPCPNDFQGIRWCLGICCRVVVLSFLRSSDLLLLSCSPGPRPTANAMLEGGGASIRGSVRTGCLSLRLLSPTALHIRSWVGI